MMHTATLEINRCLHCGYADESSGKFCGNCGTPKVSGVASAAHDPLIPPSLTRNWPPPDYQIPSAIHPPPHQNHSIDPSTATTEILPSGYPGNPRRPVVPLQDRNVPSFAHVQAAVTADVSAELKQEAAKIMVLMARERLFLYFHWFLFIGLNLLGCWLALRCYHEFIGDEMTKSMIASTPCLFINSVALCCLVPIKGTRAEIARLKEQAQFVKFKMEFGHLM